MKKLPLSFACFFLFASTWLHSQTAKRYITVEHFTNTLCSSCAAGNPQLFNTLDNNPGEVHHVSIHSEVPYAACIYYQYNTAGNNARKNLYGVNSTPTSYTNGLTRGVGGANLLPQSRVDQLVNQTSPLRIQVTETVNGNMLNINVAVKSFAAVNNPNLRLYVAITEKETFYNAPNGESEHFNVFRTMLPDDAGKRFVAAPIGFVSNHNFSVTLDPVWQANEVYALVFIQDTLTKEIWNSGTKFDLIVESTIVPEDCANAGNGSATVMVSGGQPPYTYFWDNGNGAATYGNLAAGTYMVTITDANNYKYVDSIVVPTNNSLSTQMSYTPTTAANGTATVLVTGGTAPYIYLWSNGNTMATAMGLSEGFAQVTVTDANGCTKNDSIYVSRLTVAASTQNPSCFGDNNGSVKLTVTGGVEPYSYIWSNAATTDSIGGLAAGTYLVTITDANANAFEGGYNLSNPAELLININTTDASSANNGTATVVGTGGTMPYTYSWENGATTANISQLASGDYSVTVTDANGCEKTGIAAVGQLTGILDLPENNLISLYPNPFNNALTIVSKEPLTLANAVFYNLLGERVMNVDLDNNRNMVTIDTDQLSTGIYIMILTNGANQSVIRVVKGE